MKTSENLKTFNQLKINNLKTNAKKGKILVTDS